MAWSTVNSTKYQKPISYYPEDIELCESGEYACVGYPDTNSVVNESYTLTFNRIGEHNYLIKDIERNNN